MIYNSRLNYIDVSRGLLILLVMYHHFPMLMPSLHCSFWELMDDLQWTYSNFFMASFFLITGRCSKFDYPFKQFFIKNFKSLLVPNFFLCILAKIICSVYYRDSILQLLTIDYWLFHSFWFFKALFLGKLLFWFINKYIENNIRKLIVLVFLFLFGIVLYRTDVCPNYLYFKSCFIFVLFIGLGNICHFIVDNVKFLCWASLFYFVIVVGMKYANWTIPYIGAVNNLDYVNGFIFPIIAISGSAIFFLIARFIDNCKMLEQLGKSTLVVYPISSPLMFVILKTIINYVNVYSNLHSVLLYIFIPIVSAFICCYLYVFLVNSRLKYFIGKF